MSHLPRLSVGITAKDTKRILSYCDTLKAEQAFVDRSNKANLFIAQTTSSTNVVFLL
jgi:hypothetical protein